MSALPYFIDVQTLKGRAYKDRILKVLYDTGEQFASVRFVNCGNPNQYFNTLEKMGLASHKEIPNSNGTRLRFVSTEQKEDAEKYLSKAGLLN